VLVDTHAHLYLERFHQDEAEVIDRARAAGVTTILLPAIDVQSVAAAIAMAERHPGTCYAMAAIHPSSVKEASEADLQQIEEALGHSAVVAVGESGLDYYWDQSYNEKQHHFLREHARMAIEHDLPLVLHNRDKGTSEASSKDLVHILRFVRDEHPHGERLQGVFHCFGPPRWLADAVLDLGFHIGIGGTVTYKNGGVLAAIEEVPLDRIILETDAPYLAPVPHRGKRNEPAYVAVVAQHLAEARAIPLEDLARITTANARRLFRLPSA